MVSEDRYDALVLGAGLLGSAVAHHLAQTGGLRVGLYEGTAGPSASSRSAGILTSVGWDPWDLELVRRSAEEFAAVSEVAGLGGYRETGGLRLARTREGEEWLAAMQAQLSGAGRVARLVGPAELEALVPSGDFSDVRVGLYTPEDGTFSSGGMTQAYRTLATERGVAVEIGQAPAKVHRDFDGWRIVLPHRGIHADRLILACGAWTKRLLSDLGRSVPVAPFRTQAAELRPRPLTRPFPVVHDLDLEIYARPTGFGRVLAGNGNERRETDPTHANFESDPDFLRRIVDHLQALLPGGSPFTVERSWAGVCVASPDRYPLVGRVPDEVGLYVATGFNGLGGMRAPALAGLLAEAILRDRWEPLEPADPSRFPRDLPAFDPRPEFPLEDSQSERPRPPAQWDLRSALAIRAERRASVVYRRVDSLQQVDSLRLPTLSEWFDPFLPLFMRDALQTGGEVEVAERDGSPCGVFLFSPTEGVGSVFTRLREVATHYLPGRTPGGIYAEKAWVEGGESIAVLGAELEDWSVKLPFRNPVRVASATDLTRVIPMMRELTGAVDLAWFRLLPRPEEVCFLCEIDGRIAGVSWASVVGAHARGHSFMVHPRYRGLGMGTDLLQARMLWLRDAGVRTVVSEIYEGNVASQTAAERAGMAEVGRMFHFRPPGRPTR